MEPGNSLGPQLYIGLGLWLAIAVLSLLAIIFAFGQTKSLTFYKVTLAMIALAIVGEAINLATLSYNTSNWWGSFSVDPGVRVAIVGVLVSIAIFVIRKQHRGNVRALKK